MGGTHFLQTGYLLLNRNAPFIFIFISSLPIFIDAILSVTAFVNFFYIFIPFLKKILKKIMEIKNAN